MQSEVGSIIITTEYSQRNFEIFGKIKVKELKETNGYGMKNILGVTFSFLLTCMIY